MSPRRPLAGVVVPVVLALAVAVVVCGGSGDSADTTTTAAAGSGTDVALEPVGSTGSDPFTESVAITETAEFPDAVNATVEATLAAAAADAATGGVVTTGTSPGLYGGSGDTATCDVTALTDYLTDPANTDKATAFAGVLGIAPDAIADTLATYTPVVLTVDTFVTNHGFRDGTANPIPAVLQAGTAVLVDPTGTPRVKCGCGNPLSPPPPDTDLTTTTGNPWDGYNPTTTATVTPATSPTETLTLVDTTTGDTYQQPTGSAPATTTTTAPAQEYNINLTNVTAEQLCGDPEWLPAVVWGSGQPSPVEMELDGDGLVDLVAVIQCAPPTATADSWETLVAIRGAADEYYIDILGPTIQLPGVADALRVEDDVIVVEGHTFGPDDPTGLFCCPTVPNTTKWRWEGAWTQVT